MHQVLMNLCTNAGQAMEEKAGDLEIELTWVSMNQEDITHFKDIEPRPYVLLKVSDTGAGIDPAIINQIFDPFFLRKGGWQGNRPGAFSGIRDHKRSRLGYNSYK